MADQPISLEEFEPFDFSTLDFFNLTESEDFSMDHSQLLFSSNTSYDGSITQSSSDEEGSSPSSSPYSSPSTIHAMFPLDHSLPEMHLLSSASSSSNDMVSRNFSSTSTITPEQLHSPVVIPNHQQPPVVILTEPNETMEEVKSTKKGEKNNNKTTSSSSSSSSTSSKKRKAPARKRRRKPSSTEPITPTALTIPRDKLLKMSSQELEDFVESFRSTRILTEEEEKEVKRQRRLIKNRESAFLSRQRRKSQMQTLEEKVVELTKENSKLNSTVSILTEENESLKRQIEDMKRASDCARLLRESTPISSREESSIHFSNNGDDDDDDDLNSNVHFFEELAPSVNNKQHSFFSNPLEVSLSILEEMTHLNKPVLQHSSQASKTVGVCLFVIFLSFGLFFNGGNFGGNSFLVTPAPENDLVLEKFSSQHKVFTETPTALLSKSAHQFSVDPTQTNKIKSGGFSRDIKSIDLLSDSDNSEMISKYQLSRLINNEDILTKKGGGLNYSQEESFEPVVKKARKGISYTTNKNVIDLTDEPNEHSFEDFFKPTNEGTIFNEYISNVTTSFDHQKPVKVGIEYH